MFQFAVPPHSYVQDHIPSHHISDDVHDSQGADPNVLITETDRRQPIMPVRHWMAPEDHQAEATDVDRDVDGQNTDCRPVEDAAPSVELEVVEEDGALEEQSRRMV